MQSDFQKICPRQRKRVAKNVLMAKKQKQKPQKQQQHQTKTKTTCIKCRTKCTHGKNKLNKKKRSKFRTERTQGFILFFKCSNFRTKCTPGKDVPRSI